MEAYIGQVATRTDLPQTSTALSRQLNGRRAHMARDAITAISAGYPNWFSIEHPGPAAATVYASIEYPAGIFTRLTWNNRTSNFGTIESGATGFTDLTRLIQPIPSGGMFWSRVFWESAGGILINYHVGAVENESAGDVCHAADSGLSDLTMSGAIKENGDGKYYYGPCSLTGLTCKPSVAFISDSRVYGEGDTNRLALDRGELARSLGETTAYLDLSCCADRAMWWVSGNARRRELARYCSHAIVQLGVNDIFEGERTAAQLLADRSTIFSLLPDSIIFETTIAPVTTLANKTTRSLVHDAARLSVNAALRAGGRGTAGCFDVASAVEASSLWAKTSYQCGDGVHESSEGYEAIKRAGVVDPGFLR